MRYVILSAILALFSIQPAYSGYNEYHDAAEDHFRSSKEPTALDADWPTPSSFYVSVKDNGRNRDGYAEYVCQVLMDYGFKGRAIVIRIIDIDYLANNMDYRILGTGFCR